MRILFLSRWFPCPADNGSKIRVLNLLRQLSKAHDLTLLTFAEAGDASPNRNLGTLREYCSRVRAVPYRAFNPWSRRALLALGSPAPRSLVDVHNEAMSAAVLESIQEEPFDLVIASQLSMAPYVSAIPTVPALLEELELGPIRDGALRGAPIRRARHFLTWLKLGAYLRGLLPRFTACTVVSEAERAHVRSVAPSYNGVRVIPNAVDLATYRGPFSPPEPDSLVFAGAVTYSANADAVHHFLGDIYPAIVRAVPEVTFRVTGGHSGVDLGSFLASDGVAFTGHVEDVRPIVAASWGSIAPLRMGGGTRLKILESMALGTPVVSTAKGAEGLAVTPGENILLAADAESFANQTIDLLQSPGLREHLAEGGRSLVRSRYEWDAVGNELLALVEEVTRPGGGQSEHPTRSWKTTAGSPSVPALPGAK